MNNVRTIPNYSIPITSINSKKPLNTTFSFLLKLSTQ